jgi:serine phosphatase RsbU (regulator of sigma subunit)
MRPLAAFCLFWGTVDFIWFAIELTAVKLPGIPNLYARWGQTLLDARGIATACVVAALVILLFREQRQITLDRAMLAGELHAAGEIQRMLAPAEIETAPGLHINVAFHPMREVGGDFYLCRVLPNGNQRILLGDVSGKGAAAAMAATLLMGAAEERGGDSPAELLSHLNRVLCRARIGGFATCLCADVLSSGEMIIANAGHLSPYRGGIEVATPAGLPLGIIAEAEYTAARIRLGVSDELTFVSDGVVEARNSTGELFGFERTASISTLSAESIAQTVQKHGQEDDITVLTLTLAPAGVVHA